MSAGILGYLALALCAGGAVGALAADAFGAPRAARWIAMGGAFGAAVAAAAIPLTQEGTASAYIGSGGVAAIVFALAGLVIAASGSEGAASGRTAALVALMAAATAVIAGTRDVVVLFVAVETSAIAAYALTASSGDRRSEEAAMKYFVQGAVATGAFVLALSVLVGLYGGHTRYDQVASAIAVGGGAAPLAMVLLIAVFAFKLAAWPFHAWAPDVYETAPVPAAAFMAGAPKAAAVVAATVLIKQSAFEGMASDARWPLALLAIFSIVYGNLAALKQASYRRMLGYSGIALAGYLFVGLAPTDHASAFSVALMGATYAIAATGAFIAADGVRAARPAWDGSVAGLAGLGRERPWLGAAMAACMLSLTGIPLTAGFWGKLYVFWDAVDHGFAWLAVLGVIGSVVSFGYYGAVVRSLFVDEVRGAGSDAGEMPGTGTARGETPVRPLVVTLVCAGLVVLVGVWPLAGRLYALGAFLGR
ncbi:MAG: NADH-quinone oxidoreductase subunit N [Actinobacteria bacterium]|nr:MAG: NADH-quinone oxidoreductase subunit N [Actinomycetota bacterium]